MIKVSTRGITNGETTIHRENSWETVNTPPWGINGTANSDMIVIDLGLTEKSVFLWELYGLNIEFWKNKQNVWGKWFFLGILHQLRTT